MADSVTGRKWSIGNSTAVFGQARRARDGAAQAASNFVLPRPVTPPSRASRAIGPAAGRPISGGAPKMTMGFDSIRQSFHAFANRIAGMAETRANRRAARVSDVLISFVLLFAGLLRTHAHPAEALFAVL